MSFFSNDCVENGEGMVSLPDTARSGDALESYRSYMPLIGKRPKFRVTTQEAYGVERPQNVTHINVVDLCI